MGKKARHQPRRLGKKLRQIRDAVGLSQGKILVEIGLDKKYTRNNLSNYELGKREAPSDLVLGYARLAGVSVDVLLDDKISLPKTLKRIPPRRTKATKKRGRN